MLIGVSCLLFTVACGDHQVPVGRTAPAAAGVEKQNRAALSDANTEDYINAWTFPTGDDSGKPTNSLKSKESRERMLPSETDSYRE
ncbi:MAG: hypothetical protein DRH03_04010 [Deltaproteobacteria bacterium]|nr:MAG: hypothetical protein DRH03_04010 [Deltaproteobacteria bacterium]